jgi:hypothetical protein
MSKKRYYTDKAKQRIGPVPKAVITQGIQKGEISAKSYVWNGASVPNWVHIEGVKEFETYFKKQDDPFKDLIIPKGQQEKKSKKQKKDKKEMKK